MINLTDQTIMAMLSNRARHITDPHLQTLIKKREKDLQLWSAKEKVFASRLTVTEESRLLFMMLSKHRDFLISIMLTGIMPVKTMVAEINKDLLPGSFYHEALVIRGVPKNYLLLYRVIIDTSLKLLLTKSNTDEAKQFYATIKNYLSF